MVVGAARDVGWGWGGGELGVFSGRFDTRQWSPGHESGRK